MENAFLGIQMQSPTFLSEHLEGRWQGKKENLYLLPFRMGKNFRGDVNKSDQSQEKRQNVLICPKKFVRVFDCL